MNKVFSNFMSPIMTKSNSKLAILLFGLVLFSYSCSSSDDDDDDTTEFVLTSSAIDENDVLLDDYKCDFDALTNGKDEHSLPLAWSGVPSEATSLAIIMKAYPDSSDFSVVNAYLVLWGIDTSVSGIAHSMADEGSWYMGANKDSVVSYSSPCSPSSGSHEYTITIYALSEVPASLPSEDSVDVTYDVLLTAIDTVDVIGQASLTFESVVD